MSTPIEAQLRAVLDSMTVFTAACLACGQKNRVRPAQAETARCGKCGLPLRMSERPFRPEPMKR